MYVWWKDMITEKADEKVGIGIVLTEKRCLTVFRSKQS